MRHLIGNLLRIETLLDFIGESLGESVGEIINCLTLPGKSTRIKTYDSYRRI